MVTYCEAFSGENVFIGFDSSQVTQITTTFLCSGNNTDLVVVNYFETVQTLLADKTLVHPRGTSADKMRTLSSCIVVTLITDTPQYVTHRL